jgi:LruC domain-containing protein
MNTSHILSGGKWPLKAISRTVKAVLLAGGLFSAASAHAIDWKYFGSYDSAGVPKSMIDLSPEMPSDLIERVLKKLPEGQHINRNAEKLLTDDLGANIFLVKDAEVSVAFVDEGAGYMNALGYFKFDAEDLPTKKEVEIEDRIIFPNVSKPQLKYGNAVNLGKFKAGEAIGFTLVADGWKPALKKVNPNQSKDWIFRTIKRLNPEIDDANNYRAHTVLLSNPQDGLLILGLEDINRTPGKGSDNDFNDAIIAIKVTPFSAVDRSQLNDLTPKDDLNKVDTDGDTVPDYLDVFPKDPARSAQRFYPSANGYGKLAFEDQWPVRGDYDINDMVVNYRTIETLNAKGAVTDVDVIYEIAARGGDYRRGLAFHLPGVSKDDILAKNADGSLATTLVKDDQAAVALPVEAGQKEAVFIVAPDVKAITKTGQAYPCSFFNTWNQCAHLPSPRFVSHVTFTKPKAALTKPPYNPFIFASDRRGIETHLVDQPPTALADLSYFGTFDDASDPGQNSYYRTADNLPWALDIPDNWQYPSEKQDVTNGYADFKPWAESKGVKNPSWYLKASDTKYIYTGK